MTTEEHPAAAFDEVVHQRHRLGILAVLVEADRADFGYLKRVLGLTDGNLGRHLEVLADAGMVSITKGYEGKRPRTWASVTRLGQQALDAELHQMRSLLDRVSRT